MDMFLESSIFNVPTFVSGTKSLYLLPSNRQMRMSMKILQRNNRYPFRLASNCMGPCGFRSYFNARYCGKGNNLFVGRAGLMFVGEDSESSSDENAVSGVNLKFVRELVKRGIVLAAMVCGVLVFGCRRVFAMEGVVNAGYGVIGQSILLLRNAWPKTLQVLQVFKDQGLILAALLGLTAFFSMAKPWKVCELAEKDSENGVFKTLRSDVTWFLTTILIGTIVVNIGATALVTEAAMAIFGEAGVSAATGVMTVRPVAWLSLALYPVGRVVTYLSMGMLKILGLKGISEPYVTEDELKLMLRGAELSGAIEEEEQDMIENVLEIKDTHVREVMTPLVDVVAIDASAILIDFHTLWVTHQYSRVPVFEQRVDNIVGIAYAMDLLDYAQKGELLETTTVGDMAHKPAYFVPGAQLVETPKSEFAKNPKDLMVILGQMILETLAFLDTHQRCNHVLKQ